MSKKNNAYHMLLIEKDARQHELGKLLKEQGYQVTVAAQCMDGDYDAVLLPAACSAEYITNEDSLHSGQYVFGSNISDAVTKTGVHVVEYMASDMVAYKNAAATAEGVIAEAIIGSPINLSGSKTLVIGYGRCGKILCHKLSGIGACVNVIERNEDHRAEAQSMGFCVFTPEDEGLDWGSFQYIFNTAPVQVLTGQQLCGVSQDVIILDIASKPGGVDYEYCRKYHLNARLLSGIPGKYAPKTSAHILLEVIQSNMK